MSLAIEIKKNLKGCKNYIYPRMKLKINQYSNNVNKYKYNKTSEKELFENIMEAMKKFNDNKDISNTIDYNEMNQFFDKIILHFQKKQKQKIKNQITILKNLLFTRKDNNVVPNFDDSNNENIFTINDFIYNIALGALAQDLFNKDTNDSDELYNLYLYFIFQIKEENFIIKLKILIYKDLYDEKKMVDFMINSSKDIHDINNYGKNKLKGLQEKYKEIDIDVKIPSDNMISFFKQDRIILDDLIKFFVKTKINDNFKKVKDSNQICINDIVIDSLDYKKGKVHFFSPEFLIVNGLKTNIENCDFEMFNSNNYGVEAFSKFLNLVIPEINKSIKEDNFSNNFIKDKLIQFHIDGFFHFMSAKLDYNSKTELNKLGNNKYKNSDFLRITLISNKTKNKIIDDKSPRIYNEEPEEDDKKYIDKQSKSTPSKMSFDEFQKKNADYIEDLINKKLIKNAEKDKLNSLPNILFVLNLKIPEYDEKTNSINFRSVHLDFFKEEEKPTNENYYYGWKEIDAIFHNNSEKSFTIDKSEFFSTNLTYIKEKNGSDFKVEESTFKVYPKSIVFCEIKNSFPNIEIGTEEALELQVVDNKKKKNKTYKSQLPRLLKKFKYFFKVFQDNKKENEEVDNIHLIFLYDSYNVKNNESDSNFKSIKELTEKLLKYDYNFEKSKKIIFQLVYFNYLAFHEDMTKNVEEKDKKLEEKDKKLEEKDKIIEENNKIIEENNKIIEENNKKLDEKDKIIEENNKIIEEKENEISVLKVIFANYSSITKILGDRELEEKEKKKKILELFSGKIPIDVILSYINQFN